MSDRRYYRKRLTLPDVPSDVRITDLTRPIHPPSALAMLDQFKNRNNASTVQFQLVGGVSIRALPKNYRRTGLRIQNRDASAVIFYSVGNDLGVNGFSVAPGGSDLYDFTTPSDEIYLISAANASVLVLEMTRGVDPPRVVDRK